MAPNAGDSARKGQNMNTGFKHVYGPVPSRRLGRSLGVDALTFKSCSFDCVYCQLGRTTNHTIERKEYIPTADILDEVRRKLENGDKPEYISFAGSGEPTLHSGLGDIIRGIKAMTDVPVVVFTNGSLLWMPEVRADLAAADVVIPSLDGGDAALLDKVNRPAASLDFDRIVEGLIAFRGAFNGQIWLEVMLLGGISDDDASVDAIARLAERIRPDKVQINSVCRPPAETYALPVPAARLLEIRKHFAGVPGTVEIIAEHLDEHGAYGFPHADQGRGHPRAHRTPPLYRRRSRCGPEHPRHRGHQASGDARRRRQGRDAAQGWAGLLFRL